MARAFYFGFVLLIAAFSSSAQAQAPTLQQGDAEDFLRPGDVIRVHAIGDADIVGEFMIDENGLVTLPKLGARKVTETAPAQLKKELLASYADFLRYAPEIVFLRRVMVWGAVNKPGLYAVDPTMTVANVIVLAGGASSEGKMSKIKLIRGHKTINADIGPETTIAETSLHSGDQLFIPQKPWIARNTGIAFGVVSIAITLFSMLR